jgi:hypothetical protein
MSAYRISDFAERASQVQLMGRIYQEAESVVVWLGQTSRLSAMCIALIAEMEDEAAVALPVGSACHEDKIIPTSKTAGIDAKYYKFVIIGAAAVTLSKWYVLSTPVPFMGHTLTSYIYTQVRTWVVQELCWAKDVVHLIGEAEVSADSIVKIFEVAKEFVRSLDHSLENVINSVLRLTLADETESYGKLGLVRNWGSKFGPMWVPQIFFGT